MAKSKAQDFCNFCGKPKSEALILISGLDAHICETCAEQAKIIADEELVRLKKKPTKRLKISKPKAIKEALDQYIIGQDEAKKAIAVAVYNHYKR
ncbi:MAG: ATP-dependent Clp protease ATP-binding subunit ClpX, partial [Bacteroidetes bacterium]|nr:ATP-dependent Clp protease ATP-binding subunit ClpX [Bacteroidota bacterium]